MHVFVFLKFESSHPIIQQSNHPLVRSMLTIFDAALPSPYGLALVFDGLVFAKSEKAAIIFFESAPVILFYPSAAVSTHSVSSLIVMHGTL